MRTYTQWHLHILLGCAIHRCVLLGCSCVSAELVHQGRGSKREGGSVTRKRGMREGQMDRERQRETKKGKEMQLFLKLWGESERDGGAKSEVKRCVDANTDSQTHITDGVVERWRFVLTCPYLGAVKIKLLWWECENNSSGPAVIFGARMHSLASSSSSPSTRALGFTLKSSVSHAYVEGIPRRVEILGAILCINYTPNVSLVTVKRYWRCHSYHLLSHVIVWTVG